MVGCNCLTYDSAYYADVMDTCNCKHERGMHWQAGIGHCLSKSCVCGAFVLRGKVPSPGPAGTRTSQPAHPPAGPLAGGLGSGKNVQLYPNTLQQSPMTGTARARVVSQSGPYHAEPFGIYSDPSKHWDVVIEFQVSLGATPTNHHVVELRLNIEREHAEVRLDGHEILDPQVVESQIAAIRERILAEGSWAGAAPGDIDS